MQLLKSRKLIFSLSVCLLGFLALWHWAAEPNYEGHPLSYWLNRLPPTLIDSNNRLQGHMGAEVRDKYSGIQFQATTYFNKSVAREASHIFENAGPEALPFLLKTLESTRSSYSEVSWRRWLYKLQIVNHVTDVPPSMLLHGQAVTALLLVSGRKPPENSVTYSPPDAVNPEKFRTPGTASSIVPQLVLLARNRNSQVGISASFLLREISTKDYLKLKDQQLRKP